MSGFGSSIGVPSFEAKACKQQKDSLFPGKGQLMLLNLPKRPNDYRKLWFAIISSWHGSSALGQSFGLQVLPH